MASTLAKLGLAALDEIEQLGELTPPLRRLLETCRQVVLSQAT